MPPSSGPSWTCTAKSAPIDLISTAEQLKSNNALEEAGGAVYLADLAQAVVSGANAEYYATIVRDKSLQRGLINACSSIISNCYDASREVGSLLDESEQAVFAISQRTTGRDFTGARELVDSVFENLSKLADSRDVITGVTTGYTRLDKLTAGLQPSGPHHRGRPSQYGQDGLSRSAWASMPPSAKACPWPCSRWK